MNPDPRPAPHGSEDRADMLAEALNEAWEAGRKRAGRTPDARDLLARLDAAAPARDDTAGLRRWLDGEIAEARRHIDFVAEMGGSAANTYIDGRHRTLREVRERLGATTHTTPEEG